MAFDYFVFILGGGSALLILFIMYLLTYIFQTKSSIMKSYYNVIIATLLLMLFSITFLKLSGFSDFENHVGTFGFLTVIIPGVIAYIYIFAFTNINDVQTSIHYLRVQSNMLANKQLNMKGIIKPKEQGEFGKIIANLHKVQNYVIEDYQTFLTNTHSLSQALTQLKNMLASASEDATQNNDLMMQIVDFIEPLEALIELEIMDSTNRVEELHLFLKNIKKAVNEMAKVIDLTKVVAVNASIEAAQSGDIGGGFNLVADNVRSLADKSMNISTNLLALIREFEVNITKEYERLVARAEKMKIVVDKITTYIAQIAAYSNNVASSLSASLPIVTQTLNEVNQGLTSLEQYTKIR